MLIITTILFPAILFAGVYALFVGSFLFSMFIMGFYYCFCKRKQKPQYYKIPMLKQELTGENYQIQQDIKKGGFKLNMNQKYDITQKKKLHSVQLCRYDLKKGIYIAGPNQIVYSKNGNQECVIYNCLTNEKEYKYKESIYKGTVQNCPILQQPQFEGLRILVQHRIRDSVNMVVFYHNFIVQTYVLKRVQRQRRNQIRVMSDYKFNIHVVGKYKILFEFYDDARSLYYNQVLDLQQYYEQQQEDFYGNIKNKVQCKQVCQNVKDNKKLNEDQKNNKIYQFEAGSAVINQHDNKYIYGQNQTLQILQDFEISKNNSNVNKVHNLDIQSQRSENTQVEQLNNMESQNKLEVIIQN
ncbi:hypothetical protein PPERSA_07904 [Pseudocohnilembus persalinus]|uniref:Transmembrane protein n=1 Tax=Pseudocohnilembus persalinus TaxID=266149 RepID=A0A0V0QWR9_PSEPJ|nr:hypothetical protein PPERSA_07904 [Pseudocohnilembus persalinus]|eukprot:KRX06670.1 hypothetical protein PPERSA_07904 [Pseudocohnilembus persalinus]